MKIQVRKAKKEQVYTKIAVMGCSGSGKSYSALRLATGMCEKIKTLFNKDTKILFANTEGSRGVYYANEFEYDIIDFEAPYSPENYIEVIDYAVENAYDVLIIDSVSPEWEGKGGCLELQQFAGGTWAAWSQISPRHEKFLDAIEKSPIHIIATTKSKDMYEVDKDEKGKVSIKKLGTDSKQREGFEYRFTCTFSLDQKTHTATAQKDNTHIFEGQVSEILSEKYGEKIIEWANSSEIAPSKNYIVENNAQQLAEKEKRFEEVREQIKNIALKLREANQFDKYTQIVNSIMPNRKMSECTIEDLPSMETVLELLIKVD